MSRQSLILLCGLVVSASANTLDYLRLHQSIASGAATVGRRLQSSNSNSTKCVWTPFGCDLNVDYITTFTGLPATESQKLLARVSALRSTCFNYENSTTCTANANQHCIWMLRTCMLGNGGYMKPEWLQNRVTCPGSLADQSVTCSLLTSQSSCNGNSKCLWSPVNVPDTGVTFTGALDGWLGGSTSLCVAKWTTDATAITNLLQNLNATLQNTTDTGDFLNAVIGQIVGNCPGVTAFASLRNACGPKSNRTTCAVTPGCEWTGIWDIESETYSQVDGSCDMSDNFVTDLLLNSTDTWVVALRNAKQQCLALMDETVCEAAATITVNSTRYTEFAVQEPNFKSGTGAAGRNDPITSLPLSLALSLLAMFVVKRVGLF